jgi:hypothetical protein
MNKGFSVKKNTKVTKDELKNLQDQEQKKQAILHDLGLLTTQSHTLSHMFAELALASETNKKAIEEKYGEVTINLQDGSYETNLKDEENK